MPERAGRHEQRRLGDGVVEHVERRGEERERTADADGEGHDAHVLDGGVRQEPLEVVLDEHERDGDDDRERAEAEEQIRREVRSERAHREEVEAQHRVESAVEERA